MTGQIHIEFNSPVAEIIFDAPARRNAFNMAMWGALPGLIHEAETTAGTKVIILHGGTTGHFAAGADISEFDEIYADETIAAKSATTIADGLNAIARCSKPVIAAIDGVCVGGGVSLALACDLRIASAGARIGITPAKLGLVYPMDDTRRLVNTVGASQAKDILFTGRIFDARHARNIGLVDQLVDGNALVAARTKAAEIASVSQWSVRATKEMIGALEGEAAWTEKDGLRRFVEGVTGPGLGESETVFGSLRTDYDVDFGNGQITNILGYRSYDAISSGDIDASPLNLFHSNTEFQQEQISDELRYAGTFGNVDLTTGLYYFNQTLEYTETRDLLSITSNPPVFYGGGAQDHTVYGAFANVDYSLTPDLIATVGIRYSKEEKDADVTFIEARPPCSVVDGTCPTDGTNPFTGNDNGFSDGDEWSNWTPKLGLQYFWSDNFQTYGYYTKGFRSGGYNFRITDVGVFQNQVVPASGGNLGFDEEEVDAFEIGFKAGSEDGRVQLNAAAFYTEIGDMQREVNTAGPSGVVQNILNTADATIKGVEVEGRWAATDNLLFNFNVGMIDAEYDDVRFDISGDTVVDERDQRLDLPRVPQVTYGFGAIYDLDLGDAGAVVTRANYQYRDRIAYTDSNFGWVQESDQLDANVTWETPYDGFSVSVFGDNLLDQVQVGNDTQLPFPGPLSDGVQKPYQAFPGAGTFSPLKKGRVLGVEFTIQH